MAHRVPPAELNFFSTPNHACNYLPHQTATLVFADPRYPKSAKMYGILSKNAFRRSGEQIYRPNCTKCEACIPVRVDVNAFKPSRIQRRVWRQNKDLYVVAKTPHFNPCHFELYTRYLACRHRNGGMDNPTTEQYRNFLTSSWSQTYFYEFHGLRKLLAVAVIDLLDDGISAVYTFFDPEKSKRSLGVYTILWLIEETKSRGLRWLYLGYLIKDCKKMKYKAAYRPQQQFIGNVWVNG